MLHSTRGGVGTKVVIRVISSQGCAIEGAGGLRVNEKYELYVEWQGVQIGVVGKVVSRDAEGRMGLKFLYLDKDTKTRLNDLCDTLRVQSLAPPRPEAKTTELFVPDSEAEPQLVSTERPTFPAPSMSPSLVHGRRRVPRYVSELPTRITDSSTGAT
jgi:PilZ domain